MLALWSSFFIVVAFSAVIKLIFGDGGHLNMLAMLAVLIHAAIVAVIVAIQVPEYRKVVIVGCLLRLFTMLWDMYGREIAMVPHAGADDYGYMMGAVEVGRDLTLLTERIYGGLYPKTMGLVVYFSGAGEVFVHYLNVLFGICTVLLIYKCLKIMNISEKAAKITMTVVALFPQNIFFSGTTLRESWITFLIAMSMYCFMRWYENGSLTNAILAIFFVCWSSAYHSGAIFIVFGYVFAYLFYKKADNQFNLNKRTIFMFILLLVLGILIYSQFGDVLLGNKFGNVEELELDTIYTRTEMSAGSSGYLKGLEIDSFSTFVMYAPIKMFYFITSPLPYNWRGVMDIIAFCLDSVFYIWTFWHLLKYRKDISNKHRIILALIVSVILIIFVFGVSTGNTGTAIRHRHKMMPLVALLFATALEFKQYLKQNGRQTL